MKRHIHAVTTAVSHGINLNIAGHRSGWLYLLRSLWIIISVAALLLFIAGIPGRYDQLLSAAVTNEQVLAILGLSPAFYATYFLILDAIVVVAHFFIAAVIFWRAPDNWVATFVALTLVTAPLAVIGALVVPASIWQLPADTIIYLGLVLGLSLLYLFPNGRFVPQWAHIPTILWALLNVPAIFFPGSRFDLTTWPVLFQVTLLFVFTFSGFYAQYFRYRFVSTPGERRQSKWAILGLAAAALAPAGFYLNLVNLPSAGQTAPPDLFYNLADPALFRFATSAQLVGLTIYTLVLLIFPLSFAVAILRYQLFDVEIVINRTLVYGGLTTLVITMYILIVGGLGMLLQIQDSRFLAIIATGLIAVLFDPLRNRLQRAVNRLMYGEWDDPVAVLSHLGKRLEETPTPDATLSIIVDSITQSLKLPYTAIDIKEDNRFISAAEVGRDNGHVLTLPLTYHSEKVGHLKISPHGTDGTLSPSEKRLLENIARQAGAVVQANVLERKQKKEALERERLNQELRIARLIQQTLLPKEIPSIEGYFVNTFYRPAREVGGDFYDFLFFDDGRLGIVVGDVTDKGVPAALVMATTRAVLRAAAERLIQPALVLERVNEVILADIPAQMFVTCLYALLDPATGRLTFANAGHDLPYCRRPDKIEELRATGMPLGLMPGTNYEECQTTLFPGETVLFHSDGLAEAHNKGREMFGFPRIQKIMSKHPGGSTLVNLLLNELNTFTGADWIQEDDVTLLTLQRHPLQAYQTAVCTPS